jgi:hypothetical protein
MAGGMKWSFIGALERNLSNVWSLHAKVIYLHRPGKYFPKSANAMIFVEAGNQSERS